MKTFTQTLFLAAALTAGVYLSTSLSALADHHKMEKGHTKGDGHKHGSHEGHKDHMKGDGHKDHEHHKDHKDADGHDHKHESAGEHAKHHPAPAKK